MLMLASANGKPSAPARTMLLCVPPVPTQMGRRVCAGRGGIGVSFRGGRESPPQVTRAGALSCRRKSKFSPDKSFEAVKYKPQKENNFVEKHPPASTSP